MVRCGGGGRVTWGLGRLAGFEIGGRIGWQRLMAGADIRLIGSGGGGHPAGGAQAAAHT
jgi:hypothetical protein